MFSIGYDRQHVDLLITEACYRQLCVMSRARRPY